MQRLEQPLNVGVSVVCMHADTHALCALGDGREAHSACNAPVLLQVRRQLEDLVPVWAVVDYSNTEVVERETLLVKVSTLGPLFKKQLEAADAAEYDIQVAADPGSVDDLLMANQADALATKNSNMGSIIQLAEHFHGRVVDISSSNMIIELCAKSNRCDAFIKLFEPFGIV